MIHGHVNSYDPNAPLPGLDSIWVWELDSPHARALIQVTEVFWNGEEWWTRMRTLLPRVERMPGEPEETNLNELDRFWEACTPVRQTRTARPPLTPPEWMDE